MPTNEDGDRLVLATLAEAGADLSKPAHTIHFLYFRSLNAADSAADELRRQGFKPVTTTRLPAASLWDKLFGARLYSCIAETHAVPSEPAVLSVSRFMNKLAADHGGDYDGWEAGVER